MAQKQKNKPEIRIIPLGGLGEIGKNMTVIEMGHDAIIIDTGIMFPNNDMHGVDYIIPDFRYLKERADLKIHGILYTHGHEDHIGAVTHVIGTFPLVPIYATPLTAGLVEVKLKEHNMLEKTRIHVFNARDTLEVGPFKVESYHTTHSIPDCVGFGIHTPYGLIVHTGDYKFDNTPADGRKPDYTRIADFGRRGVKLLLGDSTNADKAGWTPSERVIDDAFEKVFQKATGRIMVATFASVISRIQKVADVTQKHGRKMVISGFSMSKNVEMARRLGHLNIPDDLIVDISNMHSYPPEKIVLMVTGTQGEPSAVLGRLASGSNRAFDVQQGDTIVLSSHPIPGNEEMVYQTINRLIQRGANVVYDPIERVHVSGHASQDEMALMINLVQPEYMVPVHGEIRHLIEHKRLAIANGIPEENVFAIENGSVIQINQSGISIGERVPGGYVFVDGSGVGDIGRAVIRDREILGSDGFLVVSINIDKTTGKLLKEPDIISRGFVYLRDAEPLMQEVRNAIIYALENAKNKPSQRKDLVEETLSRMLYQETQRRPMVFSVIDEF
ncbi:ribonuclease J [Anaerolineales bacterium]